MTARTMYQQYAPNLFKLMAKRGKDDYNLFNLQTAKMYYFNTLYSYAVALPTWEGLDLSIKPDIMERIAIDNGSVVIHYDKVLERYVTLLLGAVHEWDVDGRPLKYDASPLYAGSKKGDKSGIMYRNLTPENSVIIYDTITQIPTITTIDFYAVRLANLRLTLDHIIRNCKVPYIIRTTSDNMAAIQGIFNEIYNFKPGVSWGPKAVKLRNGDAIAGYVEYKGNMQFSRGTGVTAWYIGSGVNGDLEPHHIKLIQAKFFFKNKNGKVIAKTVKGKGGHIRTNLVSGYTPYKATVWYQTR